VITARWRDALQSGLVDWVRRHPSWIPVSPNVLTFAALVVAVPACWAIVEGRYGLAILLILLSGAVDLIDGCVARGLQRTSKFGSYWDAMIDRYVDCLLYFGFVLAGWELEAFLATTGTVLTSYAKPRTAMTVEIYRQDWPTIGERAERFVVLLAGLALASWRPQVAGVSVIAAMLWATAAMTHVGAAQRVWMTRRLVGRD
jgi:archaetidylinositol phosphate synthase